MSDCASKIQIDESISGQSIDDWKSFTQSKSVTYVVDQQNGNYSNQVSFDLTSAISQNGWMSLQESEVLIPMSSLLTLGTAVLTSVPIAFVPDMLTLKNNFIQFVDSIQLFINGEQMVDQTSYSNMPLNVMDTLTMGPAGARVLGSEINFCPDTTTSIRYAGPNATRGGDGYLNNLFLPDAGATTLTGADVNLFNTGLQQRNTWTGVNQPMAIGTSFAPYAPTAAPGVTLGWPPALSTANTLFNNTLQPYFSSAIASSLGVQAAWNYVVSLPLSSLSDLLRNFPLIKGSQVRLVINFNAGVTSINTTLASPGLYTMVNYAPTAGNTNPIVISSNYVIPLDASTGGTILVTTQIQTKTVAAVATTTAQLGYSQLPNCRIYIPNYVINPNYEERLLANRIQTRRYIDWYQQPILNIKNGQQFNQVLSTAITNPEILIILPFQNGASGLFSTFTGSQWQSCFDTAPATTMPGGMLGFQNFNVQLSGKNLFNQNQNYSYDNWSQEVKRVGLNCGLNRELTSGMLDIRSWEWSPYIICDLSRRTESQDRTFQSVTVYGTNNTGVTMDYYCFIGFQKEIELDIVTGKAKRIF